VEDFVAQNFYFVVESEYFTMKHLNADSRECLIPVNFYHNVKINFTNLRTFFAMEFFRYTVLLLALLKNFRITKYADYKKCKKAH
jgi:hypothetical protein